MEVIKITPQGFCKGVIKALKIVNDAACDKSIPKPIYVLGKIIHNKHVINDLNKLGVITVDEGNKTRLELLDKIDFGTVIFSAHGISDAVYEKAKAKNLNIIDASCEDVLLVHKLIKEHLQMGYDIFYIGTKNHPESEGVLGIDDKIHLLTTPDDLDSLSISNDKIYVSNQTTLSEYDISKIATKIKKLYPQALISNNICNATTARQNALIKQEKVDLCIIVGDKESSNTKKLAYVSETFSKNKTILVESLEQLKKYDLSHLKKVSVSSGASTPKKITDEIIEYLKGIKQD